MRDAILPASVGCIAVVGARPGDVAFRAQQAVGGLSANARFMPPKARGVEAARARACSTFQPEFGGRSAPLGSSPAFPDPGRRQVLDPVTQLECEWQAISRGSLARALPAWRALTPELARFGSPRELLAFLHAAPPAASDGPLHALLCLAGSDRLAARLCLQAILPALKAHARRLRHAPVSREELWEPLLAFGWEAVCRYPTRRRQAVAANLVLQVLHDTSRELRRRGRLTLSDCNLEDAARLEAPRRHDPLGVEGLLAAAVAAGRLRRADAELILRTRLDGESPAGLAASSDERHGTLLRRRRRAELRLVEGLR